MNILWRTLSLARQDLISFAIQLVILVLAFGEPGMISTRP
jgi:hypothetical protein